jgi:hypothetical protein
MENIFTIKRSMEKPWLAYKYDRGTKPYVFGVMYRVN